MTNAQSSPNALLSQFHRHHQPVTYNGLEYTCEVVLAPRWDPKLGISPSQGTNVRVAFLSEPDPVPNGGLQSPLVAVCAPGHVQKAEEKHQKHGPPATHDPAQEMAVFRQGGIFTTANLVFEPEVVFSEPSQSQWVQSIAEALLETAYPALSIDSSGFPRSLNEADITLLFRALANGDSSIECVKAAESFAPGLGLALKDNPSTLVDGCSLILNSIEDGLDGSYGTLQWADLDMALREAGGLPGSLPLLFTLCLVRIPERRVELELVEGHGVTTNDGKPFLSRLLNASTMGDVRWDEALIKSPLRLIHQRPPTWQTVLPLVDALQQGLNLPMPDEPDLSALLDALRRRLDGVVLTDTQGNGLPQPSPDLVEAAARLQKIADAEDTLGFYTSCFRAYGRPSLIKLDAEELVKATQLPKRGGES